MSATLEGGCHCGAVQVRATAPSMFQFLCHCDACSTLNGGMRLAGLTFAAEIPPGVEVAFGECDCPIAFDLSVSYCYEAECDADLARQHATPHAAAGGGALDAHSVQQLEYTGSLGDAPGNAGGWGATCVTLVD